MEPFESHIPSYQHLVKTYFNNDLPHYGKDKRISAQEAVKKFVKPGMTIHFASSPCRSIPMLYEIIRQYWKQQPAFTVSSLSVSESFMPLFFDDLMTKAMTTFSGTVWPYPSPNSIINEAWKSGRVTIEHWSILSLITRLFAAAIKVPFLPTHSISNSTMETDNAHAFQMITDPFGTDKKIGVLSPYHPDIAILHVLACDKHGNALLSVPSGEGALSAFAAKKHVLISTETIVSTDYLKKHNYLVQIPARLVDAVIELPFGNHPRAQNNMGISELPSYSDDPAFSYDVNQTFNNKETALAWIEEWILNCPSHDAFLDKLGQEHLNTLKKDALPSSWKNNPSLNPIAIKNKPRSLKEFTSQERKIIAASTLLQSMVNTETYDCLLAGVGAANLSTWVAHYFLHKTRKEIELVVDMGFFGFEPRPGDSSIMSLHNQQTCIAVADIFTSLTMIISSHKTLGAVGAAQIDPLGNINSTCIPDTLHLLGSGGGNDVACHATSLMVITPMNKRTFCKKVAYITSPGNRVCAIVTDRCILKRQQDGVFVVTGYFQGGETGYLSEDEAKADLVHHADWDLKFASSLTPLPNPSEQELAILRSYDPHGYFTRTALS